MVVCLYFVHLVNSKFVLECIFSWNWIADRTSKALRSYVATLF